MEETGAGVLGAGIVDGGGIGPVEGTERWEFLTGKSTCRRMTVPWPVNGL